MSAPRDNQFSFIKIAVTSYAVVYFTVILFLELIISYRIKFWESGPEIARFLIVIGIFGTFSVYSLYYFIHTLFHGKLP
ncbi:MAG: hypothetical protein ACXAE3_06170, partial [Candidatus Kariarchaeaceae archaeon]